MPSNRYNAVNFGSVLRRYHSARATATRTTGDALNDALDAERDAVFALADVEIADPQSIANRQEIAIDLQREGPWSNGRDVALLEANRRDVLALATR